MSNKKWFLCVTATTWNILEINIFSKLDIELIQKMEPAIFHVICLISDYTSMVKYVHEMQVIKLLGWLSLRIFISLYFIIIFNWLPLIYFFTCPTIIISINSSTHRNFLHIQWMLIKFNSDSALNLSVSVITRWIINDTIGCKTIGRS